MKQTKKKKVKFEQVVKLLGALGKMVIIGIFAYVIIDRCGDINEIEFFFTTWR